jgi:uncharacterized protein YuzE
MEKEAIKKVIEEAYIHGIHIAQDEQAVKSGFHQDFTMLVLKDNTINKVTVDAFLEIVKKRIVENPDLKNVKTTHNCTLIDITENAAVAKIEVYKDEKHVYTDYMALYKFEEGWKIVNKIFTTHS